MLGPDETAAINARHGGRMLVEGAAAGIAAGGLKPLPPRALAELLDAAFDRPALAVGSAAEADLRRGLRGLVEGLAAPGR